MKGKMLMMQLFVVCFCIGGCRVRVKADMTKQYREINYGDKQEKGEIQIQMYK